jgi:hypothetical protein
VEVLPEAIQQQVREGKLAAQLAMKYLVPVARVNVEDCERNRVANRVHRDVSFHVHRALVQAIHFGNPRPL